MQGVFVNRFVYKIQEITSTYILLRQGETYEYKVNIIAECLIPRSLIQILDCELYELMHAHGDYTHFYFCYRWFLLDFKRELLYQDVSSIFIFFVTLLCHNRFIFNSGHV